MNGGKKKYQRHFHCLQNSSKKSEWRNPKSEYPLMCSINLNADLYWQICKNTPSVLKHHAWSRTTSNNIPELVFKTSLHWKLKVMLVIELCISTLQHICIPLSLTLWSTILSTELINYFCSTMYCWQKLWILCLQSVFSGYSKLFYDKF